VRVNTPAERRVADFFLTAGPKAAAMSAQEIAAEVGTSDATVLRTTKTLGYSSLRELRRALTSSGNDVDLATRLHATIGESVSAHDVLASAMDHHLQALEMLARRVPAIDFDAAASILAPASRLWWSGTGPSAHIADYAAFLCRRLGRDSGSLTHSGTDLADELLALRPGHAVVVLAYGRIHTYVDAILQRADAVGARVVLITDTIGQRLDPPVAVRLNAGRGVPGLFASHGATMVLVEALVLATAATDPKRSESSLASLNDMRRSIAGRRLDVDPS
jgi:DNA-binding MurR/RpiR family transcriptional regulator